MILQQSDRYPTYDYLHLDFRVTRNLLRAAMLDSNDLRVVIAKVLTCTILPFLLIAAFEAIVINGVRLILNVVLLTLNSANAVFFRRTVPPVQSSSPLMIGEEDLFPPPPPPVIYEPLPPLTSEEERKFIFIVNTLAKGYLAGAWNASELRYNQQSTQHVHPLLTLGFMMEVGTERRQRVREFFEYSIIRSTFVSDTLRALDDPRHVTNTAKYIPAFANKIGLPLEEAQEFLRQKPPKLLELMTRTLALQ